ncbi:GerMN domain-containing protein [Clostridium rectalis]|uniref:GerMN domain-containing protein n=1 Tax=Clostridium rectalis TaxID=2040295 RepID=UPI000F6361B2|nr:GerMN domain-containing protein [Clostridium rectalis]
MKKLVILCILPFLLLTSCSKSNKPAKNENTSIVSESDSKSSNRTTSKYTIKDYFPFNENSKLTYKGSGSEYAQKNVFVDYIKNNKIQLRIVNPGTTAGEILEISNGELRLLDTKEEFYYRDDLTSIDNSKYEILLKEPLIKGTSWTLANGSKRYISDLNKEIFTPYAKYNAIEVTTESTESKSYDYYVLNVGLVKSLYKSKNMEVSTSLEKIEKNVPVSQTIKFYYPDYINNKIIYTKKTLNFNTNDKINPYFEKYFKETPNNNISQLINSNVKINKVSLNLKTNTVEIDFSDNLLNEKNSSSGLESSILQCITNTLADYYNVDKVYLTINNKPYTSGHISLKENEPLKINLNNTIEYK